MIKMLPWRGAFRKVEANVPSPERKSRHSEVNGSFTRA